LSGQGAPVCVSNTAGSIANLVLLRLAQFRVRLVHDDRAHRSRIVAFASAVS
jgi:hypothetical protein